jgi:hypothetical protein
MYVNDVVNEKWRKYLSPDVARLSQVSKILSLTSVLMIEGLWMCPLLASVIASLVSLRHPPLGARFLIVSVQPLHEQMQDMPRGFAPHARANHS